MASSILQVVIIALGGGVLGALVAWQFHISANKRRVGQANSETLRKLDEVTRQRDEYANQFSRARSKIDKLKAANAQVRGDLEKTVSKAKLLAKNVLTLKTERENTKVKLSTIMDALTSVRQQTAALQSEFDKSRDFYKRELLKSLQRRKDLEEELKEARAEQEAFAKQMEASVLEHGSEENMVVAAQLRLGQLQVLERNVNKLESENSQLRTEVSKMKQDLEAQDRELEKLDELKLNNQQLVRCVEALEGSRKEHEVEAEQYREQADESEKLSETLRLKLDDLEKNFMEIEKQQDQVIKSARKAAVVPILRKHS